MLKRISIVFTLLLSFCSAAIAAPSFEQRRDVQSFIKTMSQQYGFKPAELNALFKQVQLQPKIIESMNKPYEKKNWDQYKTLFLTPERINGGMEFWQKHSHTLAQAEKKYGVPAPVIVAILGVETRYGHFQGNYRVIDALSTLSFEYPRRADFFKKELKEYLLMCREQGVNPLSYEGSYAGAIGMPQFMPSSYRAYAVSASNKKQKDLRNNVDDVIFSVANYLSHHGWKMSDGVAQPAKASLKAIKNVDCSKKQATYNTNRLKQLGITPVTAAINAPAKAGVIELETADGREYWLAYPNFYVITRYNTSPQYALAVYLLAQSLKTRWAQSHREAYAFA